VKAQKVVGTWVGTGSEPLMLSEPAKEGQTVVAGKQKQSASSGLLVALTFLCWLMCLTL